MHFAPRWFTPAAAVVLCAAVALEPRPGRAAPQPGREMSTDRPDATESPFTLEPGRAQLEMSFATYERDRQGGTRTAAWEAAPFNLRFGLTRNTEAGFFVVPYQRVTGQPRGEPRSSLGGRGDFTARTKWNLRGNAGGDFGAGVILDVTLPTAPRRFGPRKVEAALTLPTAFEIGRGWSGGAMTSIQAVRAGEGRHRAVWFNTVTAGHDLTADLGGFAELASTTGDGAHVLTFNCGLTRRLNDNLQLDGGINVGITRTAPDLLLFAGMSRRF